MTRTLEEEYFHWLVSLVNVENGKEYEDLLAIMFATEFVWMQDVRNDDNRLADGKDLRREFRPGWESDMTGSVLEVMIGLTRRMAWMVGGEPSGWAWQFLLNLGFEKFSDPLTQRKINQVNQTLENLVWRMYSPDGSGGFFPLQYPDEDQTKIELWYQMAAYIGEILPD